MQQNKQLLAKIGLNSYKREVRCMIRDRRAIWDRFWPQVPEAADETEAAPAVAEAEEADAADALVPADAADALVPAEAASGQVLAD